MTSPLASRFLAQLTADWLSERSARAFSLADDAGTGDIFVLTDGARRALAEPAGRKQRQEAGCER